MPAITLGHLLFRSKGRGRERSGPRAGALLRQRSPTQVSRRVVRLPRRVEDAAALEGGGEVVVVQQGEELRDGGRADECVSVEEDLPPLSQVWHCDQDGDRLQRSGWPSSQTATGRTRAAS